ncbi:Ribosome biogenesis protein nsa2 [Colletotrichum siamense]|uniref:Ribosome biogenesis protein NSA2 n=1 Tax=Colletotrichum siamense TaxID=690259 RepID=A0A9P5EWS1_COLSI|nr:Ribosome biogenesis protein nsa2 [Colletotrichum siamense]KAF4861207.1 Ribosome biogenesis protein nsa2 [Colletotrichum siamense]
MSAWNGGGSGMERVILVTEERARKRLARAGHKQSHDVQRLPVLTFALPKVRGIFEDEMFKVVTTGKKTHQKSWKRIVTKHIFVGEGFTGQNPKAERFIRPMGLRQKFAHVSHLTLGVTFKAPIFSVKKKNPQNPMCTRRGVLTRGAVVEVNVSEL